MKPAPSCFTFHVSPSSGFTMIEIALSLAIIGFALVAIIGVLPIGMNTQKDNREQTIINQDATMWMNAIRNGDKGLDDLTNYVMAITNSTTVYNADGSHGLTHTYGYTYANSSLDGSPMSPSYPITNGLRIVGLLSTPKYSAYDVWGAGFTSNHVVAYVRAFSGAANEKFPQDNAAMQDLAFSYRMTAEVIPYLTNYFDRSWVDYKQTGISAAEAFARSNYWMVAGRVQLNLHDVRLLFRWPLRSQDQVGPGGQSYRTLAGGRLAPFSEPGFPQGDPLYTLYLFDPRTYVQQ
jgi:type II secretory pathway pseudopilin PulG